MKVRALDEAGHLVSEQVETFGKEELLLLDFRPFNADRRIPSGVERVLLFPLAEGHGSVQAVVRYHDWMYPGPDADGRVLIADAGFIHSHPASHPR